MDADEVKRLWMILDTIEDRGGKIENFEVQLQSGDGIAEQMSSLMGGTGTAHYFVEITVPDSFEHGGGQPVEIEDDASIAETPDDDPRGSEVSE